MSPTTPKPKIVVFTGAGVSAESGLLTFRDNGGLWHNHAIDEVATPEAWGRDPHLVLRFYNERRAQLRSVQPNAAHCALAALEEKFEVTVVTQNVDDLHERAGSSRVLHVHGELLKARSSVDPALVYEWGARDIAWGDHCAHGEQLRPHIVWFGEEILCYDESRRAFREADKVLVVGTSLTVFPAAALLTQAPFQAEKVIVGLEVERVPFGYQFLRAKATELVPYVARCWLEGRPL